MQWIDFVGPTFRLRMPSTWLVIATPEFQSVLLSPALEDGRRISLTIMVRPVQENRSLEEYVNASLDAQAEQYADFEITNTKTLAVQSGETGIQTNMVWSPAPNGNRVVQTQAMFEQDDLVYIISCARPEDLDPALGQDLDNTIDSIIDSFEFATITMTSEYFQ